jgi:hypothetical protein
MREKLFTLTLFSLLFLLTTLTAAAQTNDRPPETSFEVTLSVLSGSNDGGSRGELPSALGPVAKQLRSTFGLTNLRLADTYVGRIGNNGSISYKSLANIDGSGQSATPSFLDWQIAGLRNAQGGQVNSVFINAFRFGARVPIVIGTGGNTSPIQYEGIGLTVDRMTASMNAPILIGTVAMPKADGGRVFLVLNVSPASN